MLKKVIEKGNGTLKALIIVFIIGVIILATVIVVPIVSERGGNGNGNGNNKIEVAENESSVATTFKIVHAGGIPEVGETVCLEIVSDKLPLDSMRIEWSTTSGALKTDGKVANFTALSAGDFTISAWIVGMEENASSKITLKMHDRPELQIICNSWMLSNDFIEYEVVAKGVGPYKIWSDNLEIREDVIISSGPGIASIWVEAEALSDGRKIIIQKEVAIFQAIASGYNPPALGEKSIPILKNAQKKQIYLFLSEHIGEGEIIFGKEFFIEEIKAKFLFVGDEKGLGVYEDVFFIIPQATFKRASVKGTDGRFWIIATDDKIVLAFPDCGSYRAGPVRDTGGSNGYTSYTPPADSGGSSGPSPDPDPRDPVIPTPTPVGPSPTPVPPAPTPPVGPSPPPVPTIPSPTPPPATPAPTPPPATPVPTTPAPPAPTPSGGGPSPDPNPRD